MNVGFLISLVLLILQGSSFVAGQSPAAPGKTKWRIAVLMWHESPNDIAALDGLKRGLKAMGMGEGLVELRAKGNKVKAKKLLVQAKKKGVDLFVALGTKSAQIIQAWEKKIPIVFTAVTNPVLSRITSSWTGSKKNIAGNSNWLDRKEMLRAFRLALPSLKNLLVLKSPGNSVSSAEISEARKAMKALPNLMLTELEIRDARTVGKTLGKNLAGVDAIWILLCGRAKPRRTR